MWFSRLWLVLLAAAVALLVGATQLAPKPGTRSLAEAHSYKLDLIQHNAELLLKLDARALIDGAADLSRDSRLVDILEQASARQKELEQLKQRSATVLTELLSQTEKTARPELVIMVDYRGKQIGRVGPGAEKMKVGRDGLLGYPLVAAALRGFLADDSWSLDNRLYMMAAAPVISRGRNRYVGALLLGQEVDANFATRLKRRLVGSPGAFLAKTDIAFFLRGKLLSSSVKDHKLLTLPQHFSRRRAQVLELGRSAAFTLGQGSGLIAVLAPLRGEAVDHDAFYAVVTQGPQAGSLLGWIGDLRKGDITSGLLLMLGGLLLLLSIVGLVLLQLEHAGPQKRLHDDVLRLTHGDISRLEEHRHGGLLQRLARAINEVIDRTPKKPAKDVNRILDEPGGLSTHDAVAHGGAMPPLARPGSGAPSLGVIANAGVELDGPRVDRLPAPAEGVMPLASLSQPLLGGMSLDLETGPSSFPASLPLAKGHEAPAPFSLDPIGADDSLPALTPMGLPPLDDRRAGPPGPTLQVEVTTGATTTGASTAPASAPRVGSTTATSLPQLTDDSATPPPHGMPEEAYFNQIFEEFLAIKRTCGESTDNITFDRFAAKLRKNRDSLRERYDCQEVRFRVYIKDGKAALKATPVTD